MPNGSAESASMREIRRALRKLPRERRKDVVSSIREGRSVRDPRDAALAAVWAERLAAKGQRSPWWLLPLARPRGWRGWIWGVHLGWLVGAVAPKTRMRSSATSNTRVWPMRTRRGIAWFRRVY